MQIMQPQYRNRHNFMIFGGFLLKSTFELAFTCASAYSHTRPSFIALDPSTFENPVPVGSVLYLTATVAYTDSPLVSIGGDVKAAPEGSTRIQVRVDSQIRNIEQCVITFLCAFPSFQMTTSLSWLIAREWRSYQSFI